MKNLNLYIPLVLFLCGNSINAQDTKKVLQLAMEQEIARNIENLHLEGMKDPFYIGLNIVDINKLAINSSLGSLIRLTESPGRTTYNSQVLVGDYDNNNLNFTGSLSYSSMGSLPLDNSISEIKRELWLMFDRGYKQSADMYESKQSALKRVTQTEDIAGLPDYTKGEKILIEKPEIPLKYNAVKLVQYTNEISACLKSYKFLFDSWVKIAAYNANIYYSNSEGSKATYPTSVMRLVVYIETQAPNGELIELNQVYHSFNENDLPDKNVVIKNARSMAETLAALIKAPVFNDVYYGPVLFEDQAASEVIRNTLFNLRNENLYSSRKTISGPGGQSQNRVSTEDRIGKRVSSQDLIVKAKSGISEYNGIPLTGSYPIDMDGTVPSREITLIENGILKNLLCGRVPTKNMKESNGHLRVSMNLPFPRIVPGVIDVDFNNSISKEDLKKKLLEMAQEEGLDYALIVREISPNTSELKRVYRIDVKTGDEQLIRSAGFRGLAFNDLRRIVGAGNQKRVLNTCAGEDLNLRSDYISGSPASFITPDAFLFKDMEVNKLNQSIMNKLPVVKNPMEL